ncbi:MAG: ABC transporter ATP-binding protein [Anaerolineae bacterium]|nr:ABC transporter ATP-binding protein [Anaerolineae bacterium]
MTTEPFLHIRNLSASFRGYLGDLSALDDVSFEVAHGEFVCLIGPSGCGKSTLLRIAAGLLAPSYGEILLEGQALRTPQKRVGLVFQQPALLPWRTVQDNIALPLEMMHLSPADIQAQTADLLALVGLVGFEQEYPIHLSGGMAQRAALARALAQNPEVLLLDEPFGALDALTRERMAAELLRIWERDKRTVLMVTHSVEEAALLADRVVVLSKRPGHVVEIVDVTLPRPRSSTLLAAPELQRIAEHLREALSGGNGHATASLTPFSR